MFNRRHFGPRAACVAVVGLLVGTAASVAEPPALPPATKKKVDFVADIKPLLTTHCHKCHGTSKQEGGLRLDRRDEALNGGDSGPAFVSGKSAESLLIKYVAGVDPDVLMPPEGDKLTDEQIGLLRGWIDQGADWPKDDKAAADRRAAHWSFQPVRALSPPVSNAAVHHPVDAFVRETLASRGLTPSPEADRATLIRRLSLDLLGLPPGPQETTEFLGDERPDACERLLDRLLASPHFGERWGRHWLDLARYADSDGYEKDLPRPHAWRWRNWVIDAFNRDLPFDQFTVEQLAGDLLPGATLDQRIATGFHRNTLTNKEGGADKKEDRDKQLVDRTNTTGAVWLGLTVGCAQCHSHKYDPISHREYYQLYAFFNAADEQDISVATAAQLEEYARLKAVHDVARQPLAEAVRQYREANPADALVALEQKKKEKVDPELQKLEAALAKFDAAGPKPPAALAMILSEIAKPSPTNIHLRGDFLRPGAEVQPAGLSVLNPLEAIAGSSASERPSATASRPNRLDLAKWIVDEANPLTRRVAVNRIWQHLFGRGLVDPPDDFGLQGAKPTHPELLDWLATELPRRGWSRKEMIRLIATSATYRQSSRTRMELSTVDPKNV
ncbi:MAG: PSD1 domain-containing protein, partial [Candidatus Saccharimonas sp.]|nr:PSD1 domain-containing protein [Planctomycetaceae bacterium]